MGDRPYQDIYGIWRVPPEREGDADRLTPVHDEGLGHLDPLDPSLSAPEAAACA